jgi:hypothetical protein
MKVDNLFQKTGAKETLRSSHNTQLENSKNKIAQRKLIWFLFFFCGRPEEDCGENSGKIFSLGSFTVVGSQMGESRKSK